MCEVKGHAARPNSVKVRLFMRMSKTFFFAAVLIAMGLLGVSVQAAEAPEGLGEEAEFTPKPQPVLVDAAVQDQEDSSEEGAIDERPSVTPAMREAPGALSARSGECPTRRARELNKGVAVTSFSLADARDNGLGGLNDVESGLADRLLNAFENSDRVVPYSAVNRRIYDEQGIAPSRVRWDRRLTRASRLSQAMGVQFVVSGVIRDISVEDPTAWGTSMITQWRRSLGFVNLNRRLVVDLYVHDGFSGALLMEERFSTKGNWEFQPETRVDSSSAVFERSDYGQKTMALVEEMAKAVSDTLECQPFMARIDRVENRRILIDSGTDSGIEPGDTVALYRSERFLDQPDKPPLLKGIGQTMRVESVQSSFSSGKLPVEGHRMNIQRGDRVVIW